MKQIIIHGVPVGQDIYGTSSNDEVNYFKKFYNENFTKQACCLFAEIIPAQNRIFYTYIRGNLVSNERRQGSYFALTLSSDELCKQTNALFSLFNQFYETYVLKDILTKDGNVTKYKVRSFEKEPSIKGFEKKILDQLTIASEDFLFEQYDFSSSQQISKQDSSLGVSLKDVDSPDFFEQLEKNQKVFISPFFPTKRQLLEDLRGDLSQKDSDIEAKENKIRSLQTELESLRRELESTKKSKEKSRSDYEARIKDLSNKADVIESIRKLYSESSKQTESLAKLLVCNNIEQRTDVDIPFAPQSSKKRKVIILSVIIALLFLLLIFLFCPKKDAKEIKTKTISVEQIDNAVGEKDDGKVFSDFAKTNKTSDNYLQ